MEDRLTDKQLRVARMLGVDTTSDSSTVAAARILDAVAEAIGERHGARPATSSQVEYGRALGLDVSTNTLRVASAKIEDELKSRNLKAIFELGLVPGDQVVIRQSIEIKGQQHELRQAFTISSIHPSGRLFFKGINRRSAWPTQVERLATSPNS
jgi:hypothetical protein